MKKTVLLLLLVLISSFLTANNGYDLNVTVRGTEYYNVLRISSFDVKNPQNQPIFFRITVDNNRGEAIARPVLCFELLWNGKHLVEKTRTTYQGEIPAGQLQPPITNRDIFVESGSFGEHSFSRPDPDIDIFDALKGELQGFRDTLLDTGLLPDGRYVFRLWFEEDGARISNEEQHVFTVRNAGGIFPVSPGVALGTASIPTVSSDPTSFRWSSNLVGTENKFRLSVKEFEDRSMLDPSFVEMGGDIIDDTKTANNFHSEFMNLRDGHYYVWQVSTDLADPAVRTPATIKSPFYVFRYSSDTDDESEDNIKMIEMFLMSLKDTEIIELLNSGFKATGVIELNGRVFGIAEIQAALQELSDGEVTRIDVTE